MATRRLLFRMCESHLSQSESVFIEDKPQHNQVTITELLKHLGVVKEKIRIHILNLLTSFFEKIVRGPISPIIDFVLPLTKELIHSSTKKEDNLETAAIVKCFSLYGKRMSGSEKVEAISYLLEKLHSNFKHPRTTQVLLQCILQVSPDCIHLDRFSSKHKIFPRYFLPFN